MVNKLINIRIKSSDEVAEIYKEKIIISPATEGSKVIYLSLDDLSSEKAITVLNTLISEYRRVSIEEKMAKSNNTADFY